MPFQVGQYVAWNWGDGEGEGQIVERFDEDVTRRLKGTEVTRHASQKKPAFLIEQDDGDRVLKSCTELKAA